MDEKQLQAAKMAEEKVDSIIELISQSLNLQAFGGSHVLNELRDVKAKLVVATTVEEVVEETPEATA